jgi:hypothetical protein
MAGAARLKDAAASAQTVRIMMASPQWIVDPLTGAVSSFQRDSIYDASGFLLDPVLFQGATTSRAGG